MTTALVIPHVQIRLGGHNGGCVDFSDPLYEKLAGGQYDVCATMPLPATREEWEEQHRTGRKRANRAENHGYWARPLRDRENWAQDITDINLSRPVRQGRPMDPSYRQPNVTALPDYPCPLHAVRAYGVWKLELWDEDHAVEQLVAYTYIYRSQDLALVSQVLGHADHEPNGVMHLLFRCMLEEEAKIGPGVCVYNRWDSGTWGLRQLKGWVGFEETTVEWLP